MVKNSNVPYSQFNNQDYQNMKFDGKEKAVETYMEERRKFWKEKDERAGHTYKKSSSLHSTEDSPGCYHSLPIEFLAGTAMGVTCAPKINPEIGKIATSNKRRGKKYLRYSPLFIKTFLILFHLLELLPWDLAHPATAVQDAMTLWMRIAIQNQNWRTPKGGKYQ